MRKAGCVKSRMVAGEGRVRAADHDPPTGRRRQSIPPAFPYPAGTARLVVIDLNSGMVPPQQPLNGLDGTCVDEAIARE